MPNPRATRIAGRIQQIVASLVTTRLKDPRLDMVTITDVKVTGDLQHATVYYTVYGDHQSRQMPGAASNRPRGTFVRRWATSWVFA